MGAQIQIPQEVFTMKGRYTIIKHNARKYQRARKKEKSEMLNELSGILSMNRHYIGYLLRNSGKTVLRKGKVLVITDPTRNNLSMRGRKKVYGKDVLKVLKKLWRVSGFVSSKHLVGFIRLNHDVLFEHPEIKPFLTSEIKEKLLKISPATVDRMLKPYRDRVKFIKRKRGNPFSSNVKKSVKVESWFDKPKVAGYVEVDLVHHCGTSLKGDFIYTLTATEITTGWTELEPLRNKAMIWTESALKRIFKRLPVRVKILHTDNGSEFLNAHIQRLCKDMGIEMSRSRPYRKNDAPYVECKNWSMVRAYTGWRRYDTEEEFKILKRLLNLVSLRNNLYIPQMKAVEKQRVGRRIKKKYELDTPLNRVLKLPEVDEKRKEMLIKLKSSIDIVKLSKQIEDLQELLSETYEKKLKRRMRHV